MNTIEIVIAVTDENSKDALIAELSLIDFDGFEETETGLSAYIGEADFSEMAINDITTKYGVLFTQNIIAQQNWNAFWESNFEPLVVSDRLTNVPWIGVRAAFHPPTENVAFEIVITPKMSFGTGHHATTFMVMQLMKEINFTYKSVFDFGSGTGILAILAEKLGATSVVAVDNDDWCIENAKENVLMNACKNISVYKVTTAAQTQQFDIVIANINKNIILDNLQFLAANSINKGMVVLSGLLEEDEPDILFATNQIGWQHITTIKKSKWIALSFNA